MERVVVVGGGVLGTWHAVAARRRGLDVLHLEREPEPRGASIRNFGLIWVSGRAAGPELSLALRARAAWEEPGGRGMTCAPAIAEETFACHRHPECRPPSRCRSPSPAWTW